MQDGFVVWSFVGDDPLDCKDYVRRKLGLPEWEPDGVRDDLDVVGLCGIWRVMHDLTEQIDGEIWDRIAHDLLKRRRS